MADAGIGDSVKLRLITNGSLLDRKSVKDGIERLGYAGGEVWFKLDAATGEAMRRVNGTRCEPAATLRRLLICTGLCDTWIQSCFFSLDGNPPSEHELLAYLDVLDAVKGRVKGLHLYSLARPSLQMEASRLGRLSAGWLEMLAARIGRLGLTVKVSP